MHKTFTKKTPAQRRSSFKNTLSEYLTHEQIEKLNGYKKNNKKEKKKN